VVPINLPPGLPSPGAKRMAVRLTPDAERQVRSGHPWVFDNSIASISHEGAPGDLAVIFDGDRQFLAIGLYDPASPIRVKVLHHGKPAPINADWWRAKLTRAIEHRRPLSDTGDTTGYRVVHGENDGLPGLVLDRYGTTYVLKLYSAAWIPHLATVVPVLDELLHPNALVLRWARTATPPAGLTNGTALIGAAPGAPVLFLENGLTFEADVVKGQKTGHFLDQRDNRARVRDLASGQRVLDLFTATGGFTVYAAAGGATEVHSVDISTPTLAVAARNLAHNAIETKHRTTVGDAFDVMTKLVEGKETYDLVIVDPPSFASRQDHVGRAIEAYTRLAALAVQLVRPGGVLVQCSCSSRVSADEFFEAVHNGATQAGARLANIERTGHALDHPIGFREGAYLKAWFAQRN
jgi:23S rRNA (cytosine1962-C5)-methyltransferase